MDWSSWQEKKEDEEQKVCLLYSFRPKQPPGCLGLTWSLNEGWRIMSWFGETTSRLSSFFWNHIFLPGCKMDSTWYKQWWGEKNIQKNKSLKIGSMKQKMKFQNWQQVQRRDKKTFAENGISEILLNSKLQDCQKNIKPWLGVLLVLEL